MPCFAIMGSQNEEEEEEEEDEEEEDDCCFCELASLSLSLLYRAFDDDAPK